MDLKLLRMTSVQVPGSSVLLEVILIQEVGVGGWGNIPGDLHLVKDAGVEGPHF